MYRAHVLQSEKDSRRGSQKRCGQRDINPKLCKSKTESSTAYAKCLTLNWPIRRGDILWPHPPLIALRSPLAACRLPIADIDSHHARFEIHSSPKATATFSIIQQQQLELKLYLSLSLSLSHTLYPLTHSAGVGVNYLCKQRVTGVELPQFSRLLDSVYGSDCPVRWHFVA